MDGTVMSRLTDVTFVIPVRVDSSLRARNLDVLIDFIIQHFDSKVLLLEADSCQRYAVKNDCYRIQYLFEEDHRPGFHRTRWLNHLYRRVDTPFMAGWNTDSLCAPEQIVDTAERLRSGNAVMGLPYDGCIYRTSAELARIYQDTRNLDVLNQKKAGLQTMFGNFSAGGAFIVDTEKFLQAGGENEFFTGGGPEDFEREKRIEILYPQPIYRAKGGMFHLWHPQPLDRQYKISEKKEFLKICGMCENELRDYIKSWTWYKNLWN